MAKSVYWASGLEVLNVVAKALSLEVPISGATIRANIEGRCEVDVTFVLEDQHEKALAEGLAAMPKSGSPSFRRWT